MTTDNLRIFHSAENARRLSHVLFVFLLFLNNIKLCL